MGPSAARIRGGSTHLRGVFLFPWWYAGPQSATLRRNPLFVLGLEMARQQISIVTVTLNPAVDFSASVAEVVPGPKLRLSPPVTEPGGGGVNVARAIHKLGGVARAVIAVRGVMGARLKALVEAEGIETLTLTGAGETRLSLAVTDRASGGQYRFTLPGPDWEADDAEEALQAIAGIAAPESLVVLSGSHPPGVDERFPFVLADALRAGAAKLVVDTSGAALQELVSRKSEAPIVHVLRLDQEAAEKIAGIALSRAEETLELAERLVANGVAELVVIARGSDGNVMAGRGLRLQCVPPQVPVKSKVGAGDSFTGAFVLSLARGDDPTTALQWGTAAAAAAVMTEATELCRREQVEEFAPLCEVRSLAGPG